MITNPTVFVLGAGASAEYGFPLGLRLVQIVAEGVGAGGHLRTDLVQAGFREGDLDDFSRRLALSDSLSIDTFLEGNDPEIVEIGRAAIALAILIAERWARDNDSLVRNAPGDHWLRYLWNLIRPGCGPTTLSENRVSLLTFNYDRSIETYFNTVLSSAFNLPSAKAEELFQSAIPLVHLHGTISGRTYGAYSPGISEEVIRKMAGGIRVIHDTPPSDDPDFGRATRLLGEARTVCFLGFGYHPTNIQRLNLGRVVQNAILPASTYGMGTAEVDVAETRIGHGITRGSSGDKAERFLRETARLF